MIARLAVAAVHDSEACYALQIAERALHGMTWQDERDQMIRLTGHTSPFAVFPGIPANAARLAVFAAYCRDNWGERYWANWARTL